MILLHNSDDLYQNKETISSSVFDFLVRQFALLEDEDPQMNVYGDMDFCCTTGTIGIISSLDELKEVDVLDEMTSSNDIRIFTCMNGLMPLDVVLIKNHIKVLKKRIFACWHLSSFGFFIILFLFFPY